MAPYVDAQNWANAETLARDAVTMSEKIGRLEVIARDCSRLALALVRQNKAEEGTLYARRAVELFTQLGSLKALEISREILAECEARITAG